ncbi:hypothetical protein IAT38_004475 [Cryptococcus sp. DSM 104549]
MNTIGSVAYGWGALIVAAGVSYVWAKKEIDGRRKDAQLKGTRSLEKLTWEERIAREQAAAKPGSSVADALQQGAPPATTSSQPGGGKPT